MKKLIAAALTGTLLAACGGNDPEVTPAASATRLLSVVVAEAESVYPVDTVGS